MVTLLSMTILAQMGEDVFMPPPPGGDQNWVCALLGAGFSLLFLMYGILWIWMLVDCLLREPDRFFWLWLLIVVPFPGAMIYFVVRFIPQEDITAPKWMRSWMRRRELARLEAAAMQIGNAHQFVQWGEALRDVGQLKAAENAYHQALAKEPKSLPALWGAAQVAIRQRAPLVVKDRCGEILQIDPQYKFGDVSLAYGRALHDLKDYARMREHLEGHVRRWRHPEAVYLLAEQCRADGDIAASRDHLQAMLRDLQGSPPAVARKFGRWQSRARKLLRQLPRG